MNLPWTGSAGIRFQSRGRLSFQLGLIIKVLVISFYKLGSSVKFCMRLAMLVLYAKPLIATGLLLQYGNYSNNSMRFLPMRRKGIVVEDVERSPTSFHHDLGRSPVHTLLEACEEPWSALYVVNEIAPETSVIESRQLSWCYLPTCLSAKEQNVPDHDILN